MIKKLGRTVLLYCLCVGVCEQTQRRTGEEADHDPSITDRCAGRQ